MFSILISKVAIGMKRRRSMFEVQNLSIGVLPCFFHDHPQYTVALLSDVKTRKFDQNKISDVASILKCSVKCYMANCISYISEIEMSKMPGEKKQVL